MLKLESTGSVHCGNQATACGGNVGVREHRRSGSPGGCLAEAARPALLVKSTKATPIYHSLGSFRDCDRVCDFRLACGNHHIP